MRPPAQAIATTQGAGAGARSGHPTRAPVAALPRVGRVARVGRSARDPEAQRRKARTHWFTRPLHRDGAFLFTAAVSVVFMAALVALLAPNATTPFHWIGIAFYCLFVTFVTALLVSLPVRVIRAWYGSHTEVARAAAEHPGPATGVEKAARIGGRAVGTAIARRSRPASRAASGPTSEPEPAPDEPAPAPAAAAEPPPAPAATDATAEPTPGAAPAPGATTEPAAEPGPAATPPPDDEEQDKDKQDNGQQHIEKQDNEKQDNEKQDNEKQDNGQQHSDKQDNEGQDNGQQHSDMQDNDKQDNAQQDNGPEDGRAPEPEPRPTAAPSPSARRSTGGLANLARRTGRAYGAFRADQRDNRPD
jgi:hypothetical protein